MEGKVRFPRDFKADVSETDYSEAVSAWVVGDGSGVSVAFFEGGGRGAGGCCAPV